MKNLKKILSAVLTSCMLVAQSAPVFAAAAQTDPGPALSTSDDNSVNHWIAERVAAKQQSFCYKQSYGRGVGVPLSTCDDNQQKNGLLCYPDCKAGYGGAGPVCWQECPSGYTDTGAFCHISKALTAAVHTSCSGKWPWQWHCSQSCPSGYTNAGLFCALNTPSKPAGWKGLSGLDLIKDSYGRGAGYPMKCGCENTAQAPTRTVNIFGRNMVIPGAVTCTEKLQEDVGLCYHHCNSGFYGVGPVCWESCPSGLTDCGAGCSSSKSGCGSSVANMVISPLMVVANVAAIVLTAGAGAGVTAEADAGVEAGVHGGEAGAEAASEGTKTAMAAEKEAGNLQKFAAKIKSAWADFVKAKGNQLNNLKAGDLYKAVANGDKVKTAAKFGAQGYAVGKMIDTWVKDAKANFASLTTPEVNSALDRAFAGHPKAEDWVKTQYALVNLSQLAGQDGQQTANTALGVASLVDPTGVSSVVAAYDNPKCANNDAFPTVHTLY